MPVIADIRIQDATAADSYSYRQLIICMSPASLGLSNVSMQPLQHRLRSTMACSRLRSFTLDGPSARMMLHYYKLGR